MTIRQAMCISFKAELFQALHDFTTTTGHLFKMALYTSSASLSADTTAYSSDNEIEAEGYVAGGIDLVNVTPTTSGGVAIVTFANSTWTSSDLAGARGALIYNSTNGNRAVAVLDFGSDRYQIDGEFTVTFPAANLNSAILRMM